MAGRDCRGPSGAGSLHHHEPRDGHARRPHRSQHYATDSFPHRVGSSAALADERHVSEHTRRLVTTSTASPRCPGFNTRVSPGTVLPHATVCHHDDESLGKAQVHQALPHAHRHPRVCPRVHLLAPIFWGPYYAYLVEQILSESDTTGTNSSAAIPWHVSCAYVYACALSVLTSLAMMGLFNVRYAWRSLLPGRGPGE